MRGYHQHGHQKPSLSRACANQQTAGPAISFKGLSGVRIQHESRATIAAMQLSVTGLLRSRLIVHRNAIPAQT